MQISNTQNVSFGNGKVGIEVLSGIQKAFPKDVKAVTSRLTLEELGALKESTPKEIVDLAKDINYARIFGKKYPQEAKQLLKDLDMMA